jgi:ABC-type glutathione transport system ATPase component
VVNPYVKTNKSDRNDAALEFLPLSSGETECSEVRRLHEEVPAHDEVTVEIRRRGYVSLSGLSACGKSTFLAILALLDTPSQADTVKLSYTPPFPCP